MVKRIISGAVLLVVALVFIIAGGPLMIAGLIFFSEVGMYELNRIFKTEKSAVGILSYIVCAIYYVNLHFVAVDPMVIVVIYLILLLSIFVLTFPKFHTHQIMAAFFGFFYVGVMLSYLYQTRMLQGGAYIVWLIVLCSSGCDTMAYFVGSMCGKHKMAPVLSPKKSVEGAVGGVIGAMVLTAIYCVVIKAVLGLDSLPIVALVIFTGIGALISMIGDLAASAIKRNFEIKDYGNIMPGHGGILDRFDSIIITAPIIYYLAYYFNV